MASSACSRSNETAYQITRSSHPDGGASHMGRSPVGGAPPDGLLGNYWWHDLPFLAELCLHGRLHEVPERLFYMREHRERSIRRYDFSDPNKAIVWYDPSMKGSLIFPR
jgi:hypothetical protein